MSEQEPRLPEVAEVPEVVDYPRGRRWATRLAAHSTAFSRRGTTVLRYRFPTVQRVPG